MSITRVYHLLLAIGFAVIPVSDAVSAADTAAPQPRPVIATIFSKPIYAEDLDTPPEKLPAGLTDAQRDQWRVSSRNDKLSQLIWAPLVHQFCQRHACEPTDKEMTIFVERMESSKTENRRKWAAERASLSKEMDSPNLSEARKQELAKRLHMLETFLFAGENFTGSLSPEQEAAAERGVANQFIRAWKLNKALYDEYGGSVIFQQAGIEPLGAYRTWLEAHERKGDFQILDPTLRTAFWAYYVSTGHTFIPVDELQKETGKETGLKSPFEKPWWLMEPKKTP